MQIIIPMSGVGQRFINAGYKTPKPLIKVEKRAIIEHVCDLFPGENDFIFICNKEHLKKTNIKKVLKKLKPKSKIISIDQHKKGPVYSVSKIFNLIKNQEVIISYCDYGTNWSYKNFLKYIRLKKADGAIAAYKGFHPHMLANNNYAFIKEKKNKLVKIKEKESFTKNKMNEFASNGTYYFKKGDYVKKYFNLLLKKKIKVKNEYYVSLVYNLLTKDKLKTFIYEIDNILQWGTPEDLSHYLQWSNYFKKKNYQNKIKLKNHINLMPLGGIGNRYKKEGFKKPKALIQINKKPMFINAMQALPSSNSSIFVCRNEFKKKYNIKKTINLFFKNSKVKFLKNNTKGQASTCEIGLKDENNEKSVLIGTCDCSISYNQKYLKKTINNNKNEIIVFTFRKSLAVKKNPNDYSYVNVDKANYVKNVSEKKKISNNPINDHAIIGIFYFKKIKFFFDGLNKIYKKNYKINNEFYVDSIIKILAKNKYRIKAFEVDHYIGWGTPNDFRTYKYWQKYFEKN